MSERQTESMSPGFDNNDEHTENHDDAHVPGKPGRKKNPNTATARRDQNRIAQREFRLRKQQRIRDLEARVELLSGDKDETHTRLRAIIRELMQENVQLRNLLKDVTSFVGEGIGGNLQRIGWEMTQFQAVLDKSESDTAFEAFIKSKGADGRSQPSESPLPGIGGLAGGDVGHNKKRKRTKDSGTSSGTNDHVNGNGNVPPTFNAPSSASSPTNTVSFSTLLDGFSAPGPSNSYPSTTLTGISQPHPVRPTSEHDPLGFSTPSQPASSPSTSTLFQTTFTPSLNVYGSGPPARPASNSLPSIQNLPSFASGSQPSESQDFWFDGDFSDGSMTSANGAKKHEACRLIKYHLDNFRRNPMYCLPRSLNPTLVQKTIPHEGVIDGVPYSELRDGMILLKDRFSLPEAIHSLFYHMTVHGDDVMQHSNWEVPEVWMKLYPFLVTDSVISCANRWRKERGEPELSLSSIGS